MKALRTALWRGWVLVAAVAVLAGCASGPKYSEMSSSIPTLRPGEGRIFFLRSSSMLGAALQPDIRLNGHVVGASKPGGFFYVDRTAGRYIASTATETEKTVTFALDPGETKYLRTSPSFGVLVGRVMIDIETPEKAKAELPTLSNTGAANTAMSTRPSPPNESVNSTSAMPAPGVVQPAAFPPKPANAISLDIARIAGQTWRYPHREERYVMVELTFAVDKLEARNKLSHTSGSYTVRDDMLCTTYASRGWPGACYYLIQEEGQVLIYSLSINRKVPLEICSKDGACVVATRAMVEGPARAAGSVPAP